LVVVVLVVLSILWVGVRGLLAGQAIAQGVESATSLGAMLTSGDVSRAAPLVADLKSRAAEAHELTSDPVWRAIELLPVLGSNLTTARESIAALDGVVRGVVPEIVDLSSTEQQLVLFDGPRAERIAGMAAAAPAIGGIADGLQTAAKRVGSVDPSGNIAPLAAAFGQVDRAVASYARTGGTLDGVARVALALSAPDSPDASLPWTLIVLDTTATNPIALVDFTAAGGAVVVGAARPRADPIATGDQVVAVDLDGLRFLLERAGGVRVDGIGSVDADSINQVVADAAALATSPEEADQALARVAAAVFESLFA